MFRLMFEVHGAPRTANTHTHQQGLDKYAATRPN